MEITIRQSGPKLHWGNQLMYIIILVTLDIEPNVS